jgi:hypothetical protein
VSETGMKETLLLTRAGCDRRTLRYLRQGRRITTDVHDNIVNFMAAERARRAKAAPESAAAADTPTEKPGGTPADADGNGDTATAGCDASGESEPDQEARSGEAATGTQREETQP